MYTSDIVAEEHGRVQKVHIVRDSAQLTYAEVIQSWQTDNLFRAFFISILSAAPYAAFRWETPPVTYASVNRLFEFALIDSPHLNSTASPAAFQEFFSHTMGEDVVVFSNLGKDATLIVPVPQAVTDTYAHLASFTRQASENQQGAFWQKVGEMMQKSLGEKPIWLNTAGAGVPWLHIRLDSSPKYYRYSAYRSFSVSI